MLRRIRKRLSELLWRPLPPAIVCYTLPTDVLCHHMVRGSGDHVEWTIRVNGMEWKLHDDYILMTFPRTEENTFMIIWQRPLRASDVVYVSELRYFDAEKTRLGAAIEAGKN